METAKKIRIYPCPNVEIKLSITDEMLKDWKTCEETCANYDENGDVQFADCDKCSWNNKKINGIGICTFDEVDKRMERLIHGEQEKEVVQKL